MITFEHIVYLNRYFIIIYYKKKQKQNKKLKNFSSSILITLQELENFLPNNLLTWRNLTF